MKKNLLLLGLVIIVPVLVLAQNVGIGTTTATEKLEVVGNIKANGMVIADGGNAADFVIKSTVNGNLGFRKGNGAQALRYIICVEGVYPSQDIYTGSEPFLAEVRMFAGSFAPRGWRFCEGQLLPINQNQALFSLIGDMYGGNGQTNFALPDFRGATAVGSGTNTAGYSWLQGQKSN